MKGTIEGYDRKNHSCSSGRAILYACLTAGDLSEKRGPQRQFGVEGMVGYSSNNCVILVIEGPDAIIDAKGVPARVYR